MKIIATIKGWFKHEKTPTPQGPWNTVTKDIAFGPGDVFESAKTVVERQVLAPGTLSPGTSGTYQNPVERELREKVVFRNGTVITEDSSKKEVTIQPKDAEPIVLHGATMTIDPALSVTIQNATMKQTINRNGSFNVADPNLVKYHGYKYQTTYTVTTGGYVSGAVYPKKNKQEYVSGEVTPEGYLKAGGYLVSPFVQLKYIVNPAQQ